MKRREVHHNTKMTTKPEEQKPEPDRKKKWYDDAEMIRMGTDLVAVINFHMSKLKCMHCYKITSMALELHGRNELYRYKNEMWKKTERIRDICRCQKFQKNDNVTVCDKL